MKVAIIHYWFITRRGGEKVVESILKLYPNADIYTLFYDKGTYGDWLNNNKVYSSRLNNKFFRKYYQKIFPLYPFAVKSMKLREKYDLIISSESGPIKGIKIEYPTTHICYIHTPMRYCWGFTEEYLASINFFLRPIASYFFKKLKNWDKTTIDNVDFYIANSKNVARRVKKFYNRDSDVIYPPIASNLFAKKTDSNKEKSYFLSFGAITPYKKIDLLVDCFNISGKKLIIIGDGSEKKKLQKRAKDNIEFKGFLKASELDFYVKESKALLFPGEEDFGMIPLEVMAYGIPVIAFKKGGALETVVENRDDISKSSGIFFERQSSSSLQRAIEYFLTVEDSFDSLWIRKHAQNFEESKFLNKFSEKVNQYIDKK